MKLKASEYREDLLKKGVDAADAEILVKAKVDANEVEDDEVSDEADLDLDAGEIDAFAEKFGKSRATPLAGDTAEALAKSEGEPGDLLHLLETFAAAQDETLARIDDNHTILGEGVLAVGKTTQSLVKAFSRFDRLVREGNELMAQVRDRLGEPVPPRAVDTAAGAAGEGADASLAKGTTSKAVQKAVVAEMKLSETTRERRQELGGAMERLERGEDPAAVAKHFKVTL